MSFEIVFTGTAKRHFHDLDAKWRAAIKEAMEAHLRHEPAKTSKSRIKRLREIHQPQYRLRVAEYRVFYDLDGQNVVIITVVPKNEAEAWLKQFGIRPT